MASGSHTNEIARTTTDVDLPYGYALTSSGRISGVTEPGELSVHYPFSVKDLVALDNALTRASIRLPSRSEPSAAEMPSGAAVSIPRPFTSAP